MKISVIVPVYNAENYLSRCVQSILSQNYKDFELLLVDDGSSDMSGSICDGFARLDARVKVWHQRNKGVSAARNQGMRMASGEWVTFVDADDMVDTDYLQNFVVDDLREDDIVFQGLRIVNGGGKNG